MNIYRCICKWQILAYTRAEYMLYTRKHTYTRRSKLLIPKLEDANWAGGSKSSECTLILTEGDSAKALAVAGLSVVGRDRYMHAHAYAHTTCTRTVKNA
jgi:DNA topoisomerase-2